MALVFFDIDGTLADRRDVPKSAAESISILRANGHKVFICSGRFRPYATKYFDKFADGFICCNGRLAFMGDKTILSEPLSVEQVERIVNALDPISISYVFYEEFAAHFKGTDAKYKDRTSKDISEAYDRIIDPKKMKAYNFDVFYDEDEQYRAAVEALSDFCLFNMHGPYKSADVTIIGADKGKAINKVLSYLGVAIEDSYAFGDGLNDISMLKAVGHGIAMGNGVDEVKAVAEYVTTDMHADGVKNGLLHYELI